MAMLTGPEIERQIKLGGIVIDPFTSKQRNPNSYNLRLGNKLLVYKKNYPLHHSHYVDSMHEYPRFGPDAHSLCGILDMAVEEETIELNIPPEGLVLWPGVLYLGSTVEYTETDHFVPSIEGRSGVGRLGLTTHVTAGFGDCHFHGDWTLELTVILPLRVYAGAAICQIAYTTTVGEMQPYTGKYQGQRGPKPSRLWREFQR